MHMATCLFPTLPGAYLEDGALAEPSELARDDELARSVWARSEEAVNAAAAAAAAEATQR